MTQLLPITLTKALKKQHVRFKDSMCVRIFTDSSRIRSHLCPYFEDRKCGSVVLCMDVGLTQREGGTRTEPGAAGWKRDLTNILHPGVT